MKCPQASVWSLAFCCAASASGVAAAQSATGPSTPPDSASVEAGAKASAAEPDKATEPSGTGESAGDEAASKAGSTHATPEVGAASEAHGPNATPEAQAAPGSEDATESTEQSEASKSDGSAAAPSTAKNAKAKKPGLNALGTYQTHLFVRAGVRASYINDTGYDLFSNDDGAPQFEVAVGRTVATFGSRFPSLSLVGALGLEVGGTSADLRLEPTQLNTQRFEALAELRKHLIAPLYVFVRPGLGAVRMRASIDEGATQATLERTAWAWAVDLSAGAAAQIYGAASGSERGRLWVGVDGGYGWTDKVHLKMDPSDNSDAPERTVSLDLGDLTLSGPFFRLSVTATY